jgi:hypothetical protein
VNTLFQNDVRNLHSSHVACKCDSVDTRNYFQCSCNSPVDYTLCKTPHILPQTGSSQIEEPWLYCLYFTCFLWYNQCTTQNRITRAPIRSIGNVFESFKYSHTVARLSTTIEVQQLPHHLTIEVRQLPFQLQVMIKIYGVSYTFTLSL